MPRTARLEVRLDPVLKGRVEEMADRLGQTTTVFVERALEAALAAGPNLPTPAASPDSVAARRHMRSGPAFNRATSLKR